MRDGVKKLSFLASFVTRLGETLIGRVAAWEQLHLNQQLSKTRYHMFSILTASLVSHTKIERALSLEHYVPTNPFTPVSEAFSSNEQIPCKKNAVFWSVAPCRCSGLNRCFGGSYRLHLQGRKIRERRTSVSRWLQN
jgi:hypothetical protein